LTDFWTHFTWLALLNVVTVAIAIPVVMITKKGATSPVAWCLIILFLPLLGSLLFWIFGYTYLHRPLRRKRKHRSRFRKHGPLDSKEQAHDSCWKALGRVAWDLDEARLTSGNAVSLYSDTQNAFSAIMEAMRAASPRTRVVCIRTGLVLERDGGALSKMLPPFWFGAGGRVGSGRQYWPWIHRQDWIDLVRFAIRTAELVGPLNATAPNPATNADFAHALGRSIGRPSLMPTPGFALKLLLGEMAEALLLSGQRAVPAMATHMGYEFAFTDLAAAFRAIFTR